MNKCCWLYAKDRISVYAACFIGKSVPELVDEFNKEVGTSGWTQDRVYYHEALLQSFIARGVDISAITDGETVNFTRQVVFNEELCKLVLTD